MSNIIVDVNLRVMGTEPLDQNICEVPFPFDIWIWSNDWPSQGWQIDIKVQR